MTKMVIRAVFLCLMPAFPAAAQEASAPAAEAPKAAPRPEPTRPRPAQVPLRVQIAIARFEGDKMVANLPFTLMVNAGDGGFTSLRMGVEMPVPVTTFSSANPGGSAPNTSYQYRTVGINIDCRADPPEDGRYRVEAKVEQSSVRSTTEKRTTGTTEMPIFRTFNTSFKALLRDGQTTTHVVATDPVSGEISRIELGMTVVR